MFLLLLACASAPAPAPTTQDCHGAKNTCPDYAPAWQTTCPAGKRCVTFSNLCPTPVAIAYQIGCNGDGTAGAPQCNCTDGPSIAAGASVAWTITDGDYTTCLPAWSPACLTAGLAIIANPTTASCTAGTRVEFTAGNKKDSGGRFDSYDIDVEKAWYSVPVSMAPNLPNGCAIDHANHDCRPLYCNSATCPDAYATPTTGGCKDGRSPAAGCQDTFNGEDGYTVTFCPTSGASCQDAAPCSPP
jgi:hypothetical protein